MQDELVLRGPPFHKPISSHSLGIQLYNSLLKNGSKDILIDGLTDERLTCEQLLEETCRLAEAMRSFGLRQGDVIAVCSENNLQFFQPVIAAQYLGVTVTTINNNYVEGELYHALSLTKPKIIFCSQLVVDRIANVLPRCPSINAIVLLTGDSKLRRTETLVEFKKRCGNHFNKSTFTPVTLDPCKSIAVILFSSGTTGLPKGVMTSHENINVRIVHQSDLNYHIPSCRLVPLPLFHGFGFMVTLCSIILGDTVVIMSKFTEQKYLQLIVKHSVKELWVVPTMLLALVKSPLVSQFNLSCVEGILSGAAPLGKELSQEVCNKFGIKAIKQGYGMTESTLAVCVTPMNQERLGSSGKVISGMQMKIRNPETNEILGRNQVGEVCMRGKMITLGYLNNPEATKQTYSEDGWLYSGDVGYFDDDGFLFIVDRIKELIKYKGFQVAPAELEAVLIDHPKIKEAGVVGKPDEEAGELPFAFIIPQPGAHITEDEVKKFVEGRVSYTKYLRGGVRFVQSIPKTASGKILRTELKKILTNLNSKL